MLPQLDNYDWASAFEYAGGDSEDSGSYGEANIRPASPTSDVSCASFGREDVAEIRHIEEGENDGPDWICVGRLGDGRWFCLEAGCDYTGWDCQAAGGAAVATTYKDVVRLGCSAEARRRFGITLPS